MQTIKHFLLRKFSYRTLKSYSKAMNALKQFLQKVSYWLLWPFLPLMARAAKMMAYTGFGTDACLKLGCLPLPVHFYSPIPDIDDLAQRKVWDRKSELTGIDFQPERQIEFLLELGRAFGSECSWPLLPTDDPYQFYLENDSFSFGCAAATHSILRRYKPRRVVEIGSGNSSLVISSALRRNMTEGHPARYTIVDPYPRPIIEAGLPGVSELRKERVELLDVKFFDQLQENDVLFVDSGHTVRTGGDVNYLILDVLPRLAPGAVIHFHDIGLPYEYPKVYFTNPQFRVFWTEAYLLQAFLSLNSKFEVLLALSYLMTDRRDTFCMAFPSYDPSQHRAISGSFWIRRISEG